MSVNNKRFLLHLFFLFLGFGQFSVAQQAPIFPIQSTFPVYQPPCSGCDYLTVASFSGVSGDFNGDGKLDLAYVEGASNSGHDTFIVVAFGQANGLPNQVATDLQSCSASAGGFAAADVNHDGHLDLVMPCGQGYTATLLGNGDGTFQAPMLSPFPGTTANFVLADFNGDGLPDIVYAYSVSASGPGYAVSLNNGGGQFGAPKTYSLTTAPSGSFIAAGDFNGDGKQDLVFGTGYVLGNGDGTFGQEQTLPTGISGFAVGDFNHNGFSDLAYSLSTISTGNAVASFPLYFLQGSSSGLTSPAVAITGGGYQDVFLKAVDLTGNGNLDLVASLSETSIFLGRGDGSFSSPIGYSFATSAFADINADGILDLVEVGGTSVSVAYGNGDGTVQAPPLTIGGSLGALSDMNGDGLPDVVSKFGSNSPQVYLSTGDGRFTPAPPASGASASDFGQFVVAADFTGDGHPDVISVSTGYGQCHGQCPQPQLAQVLSYHGDGDGTLTFLKQLALGVETVTGVVTGDFNHDAKQDFVLTYFDAPEGTAGAIFVAGNGDGTFTAPTQISLLGHAPSQVVTADLNGDNKADLVIADQGGTVISYLGNGDGTFTPVSQILSISTNALLVADVTGDGIPDLLCISLRNLMVFPGKGDGSFMNSSIFTASIPAEATSSPIIQAGDLNGDGLADIGVSFYDSQNISQVAVFLNTGNGNFSLDPNFYSAVTGSGGFALTRLNAKGPSTGQPQLLDALVSGGSNLVSLLNQRNPAPVPAPSLTVSNAGGRTSVTVGQTVTLNAVVTALGKNAPSGTVNFLLNQKQVASSSLSQNQASAQIKIAGTGAIAIQAVYSGDSNYPGASGFLMLTSAAAATTTLTSSAGTAAQGTNVTFTAGVAPATATGTVSFMDGSTTLGTASLSSGSGVFATAGLAVGSHTITAVYGGDANYTTSTSPASVVTITLATYQLSASPTTLNISQGGTGSTTITVTPTGAYNGTVALGCAGLPVYSTCSFAPAAVPFNGTSGEASQTIVLTIATNVLSTALLHPSDLGDGGRTPKGILFASLFLAGALLMNPRRRKGFIRLITLAFLGGGVFLSLSGCSGGSAQQTKDPMTPAGTSMVTVSSSSSVPSLTLTVNISQ
jgi:hypothetical protein